MDTKFPAFDKTKLPDPNGIPFEGIEGAEIPGRKDVAKKINEFIVEAKRSKAIEVQLITAAWGEGKTDAYGRYIAKHSDLKDDYRFDISTSTIVNNIGNLLRGTTNPMASINFLSSLFSALSANLKSANNTDSKLFEQTNSSDLLKSVNDSLTNLFDGNKKQCYIFLDEFEEILVHPAEIQTQILSGIKELVNKKCPPVCDPNNFGGRLHLIIACTPEVWNRIKDDPHLGQIFGGLSTKLPPIDLPTLSASDSFHLLTDLTRITYENKPVLPIASSGVFGTIVNASQKNPRALIQLYHDLMTNVRSVGTSEIAGINCLDIIENLKTSTVIVSGDPFPAFDNDNFKTVENSLANKAKRIQHVLKILAAEHTSFTLDEITQRISESVTTNDIEDINFLLRKENNILQSIVVYLPLKENKTIDEVIANFNPVGSGRDARITDPYQISIDELKELLTYRTLINGEIKKKFQIPARQEDFARLLDTSSTRLQNFYHRLKNGFDENSATKRYSASLELLENIFPSPNITKFDFIEDVKQRPILRSKIRTFIADPQRRQELHKDLTQAIIESVGYSQRLACNPNQDYTELVLQGPPEDIPIPCKILAWKEDITEEKIKEALEDLKTTNALVVLLFYHHIESEEIREKINQKENIQMISLETVPIEQLLAWRDAKTGNTTITPIAETQRLEEIYNQLDVELYLREWVTKGIENGIVVTPITNPRQIGSADVKPAISNFITTSNLPIDEQWDFYQELSELKLFAATSGTASSNFAPADIETEDEWIKWGNFLQTNKFIKGIDETKVECVLTPIESRIIHAVNNNANIKLEQLKKEFIFLAEKAELKNYYIDTLVTKGIISVNQQGEHEYITAVDVNITGKIESIRNTISAYDTEVQNGTRPDKIVCQSKDRAYRVIAESKYFEIMTRILQNYDNTPAEDPTEKQRLARLLINIYDYYEKKFLPVANDTQDKIRGLYNSTNQKFTNLKTELNLAVSTYNAHIGLNEQVEPKELIVSLENDFDSEIKGEFENVYTLPTIQSNVKTLWDRLTTPAQKKKFPFNSFGSNIDNHSSYKYYKLKENCEKFEQNVEATLRKVNNVQENFEKIEQSNQDIQNKIRSYSIPDLKLSNTVLKSLRSIKPGLTCQNVENLDQVESNSDGLKTSFSQFHSLMTTISKGLDKMIEVEKTFIENNTKFKQSLQKLEGFFYDTNYLPQDIGTEIADQSKEYDNLVSKYESEVITNPNEVIQSNLDKQEKLDEFVKYQSDTLNKINEIIDKLKEETQKQKEFEKKFMQICLKKLPDPQPYKERAKEHLNKFDKLLETLDELL